MLLVTMFCYMFFYTGRHNFGWAAKAMAGELHVSYELIGWVSFAMLIGYAIGQLVNGNLADHFNPRYMIPLGGLLSISCNFAISFAHSFQLILFLWALNGFCQSMAFAPGSRLISNWWGKEEKSKAFGFYTMAAGASSVITFLLSVILLQKGLEWRWLFRIPVLFLLVGITVFLLFARGKPSDIGYANLSADTDSLEKTNWKERYKAVFSNKAFLITCVAMGFESMARYGLVFWVPIHYLGKDWSKNPHYLWITVLMPVGMAVGAFSFGNLSDTIFRSDRPASIRFGILVSAVISLLIYFVPVGNVVIGAILLLLAGFFVYGPQANFWTMSPELLGEKYVGTGIGIMNMAAYLFAAMGEPLLGKVIDMTHDTSVIFLVITVLCLACAVTISFVNTKKIKQTGMTAVLS
ncbi:MFS transporter [Taibaiella soli]|uniref:MFS transporter n=2 Tax=Taibaiella soli TaxID=1649169 RepID=A0A2W2B6L6_9BACT|nr:MFS transporter [Taibaiella soli]